MQLSKIPQKMIILFLMSNIFWKTTSAHTPRLESSVIRKGNALEANQSFEKALKESAEQRRPVTEEEISYIANTLQPRECLGLLYLLHHAYKRRRRRDVAIRRRGKNRARSAQITPCETMLLNYWRDPKSGNERDCSHVSRTLRQVKRQDLARWLCGRRSSCSAKTVTLNGTNDASLLTAQMQVIPIYSGRSKTADRTSNESTFDSIIWIYIALAVCATATVLLCVHYLFMKFQKSSKYITLGDKDLRNYNCGCIEKRLSLSCNKKKRYQPPHLGCPCSGN